MKENTSKNKVWQIVGVSVLCAVLVLGAVLGVVFGMHHSTEDLNVSKDMSDKPDDSVIMETQEENGIMLTSGVATTASDGTSSRVLTATISPSDARTEGFTWSVAFKNESSTWATGKTVTDYVTVKKDSSTDLKATVICKKAFGEQIIVRISCDYNAAVTATATLDYKARVASGYIKFTGKTVTAEDITLNVDGTIAGSFSSTYGGSGLYTPKYTLSLSEIILTDGTIKGDITLRLVHPNNKNLVLLIKGAEILTNGLTFEFPEQMFDEEFFSEDASGKSLCVQLLLGGEVAKEWNVEVVVPQSFASSVSLDVTTIVF